MVQSFDALESDSSVFSNTSSPTPEQSSAVRHQNRVDIKELKHQPYDCMLELEDDEDNETIDTEVNPFSNTSGEYIDVLDEQLDVPADDTDNEETDQRIMEPYLNLIQSSVTHLS